MQAEKRFSIIYNRINNTPSNINIHQRNTVCNDGGKQEDRIRDECCGKVDEFGQIPQS